MIAGSAASVRAPVAESCIAMIEPAWCLPNGLGHDLRGRVPGGVAGVVVPHDAARPRGDETGRERLQFDVPQWRAQAGDGDAGDGAGERDVLVDLHAPLVLWQLREVHMAPGVRLHGAARRWRVGPGRPAFGSPSRP